MTTKTTCKGVFFVLNIKIMIEIQQNITTSNVVNFPTAMDPLQALKPKLNSALTFLALARRNNNENNETNLGIDFVGEIRKALISLSEINNEPNVLEALSMLPEDSGVSLNTKETNFIVTVLGQGSIYVSSLLPKFSEEQETHGMNELFKKNTMFGSVGTDSSAKVNLPPFVSKSA